MYSHRVIAIGRGEVCIAVTEELLSPELGTEPRRSTLADIVLSFLVSSHGVGNSFLFLPETLLTGGEDSMIEIYLFNCFLF